MIYVFNMNNLSALGLRKLTESCSLPAGISLVFREIFLVVRLRGARFGIRPGLPLRYPPGSIIAIVVVNITPRVQSGLVLNCKEGELDCQNGNYLWFTTVRLTSLQSWSKL